MGVWDWAWVQGIIKNLLKSILNSDDISLLLYPIFAFHSRYESDNEGDTPATYRRRKGNGRHVRMLRAHNVGGYWWA
jgi:hypothetical protein